MSKSFRLHRACLKILALSLNSARSRMSRQSSTLHYCINLILEARRNLEYVKHETTPKTEPEEESTVVYPDRFQNTLEKR